MTVEEARNRYLEAVEQERRHATNCHGTWRSRCFGWMALRVDAASLGLDLAVSEAHPAEPPLSLVAY